MPRHTGDARDYLSDMHDYVHWNPKTYIHYKQNGEFKLYEYDGYATEAEMKQHVAKMIYEQNK